jgi:putative regulator of septum formation
MVAPAGVGGGSAPEPATPEPASTEPDALEPDALEPDALEPDAAKPDAAEPDGIEPVATEPLSLEAAVPEQSPPAPGESVAAEVRAGERGGVSGLVVAGVILVLVAVAVAAGVLVVATHGSRHKTIITYRPAAVFSLRAGDCLNSSPNGLSVTILSCATPHQAEVFATFSLTGSSWPGEAAVQQQASSGCANRIAGYLNPQLLNAGLTQQYVYPDQEAWQAGVRTVVCEVSSASGPLSGSVRNGA